MEVGFGVFTTGESPVDPGRLQGVADYEVRDEHALIRTTATLSNRKQHEEYPAEFGVAACEAVTRKLV